MLKHVVGPRLSAVPPAELDQRDVDWADLIVGDSRIVMDSLLGCDLMTGKVQMIYLDPPGGSAGEAHADAAYLRDRLGLCRALLHESGSIFVRTSDERLPALRRILDEVFGDDNFCGMATLKRTSGQIGTLLPSTRSHPAAGRSAGDDYLVWYSRDGACVTYRQLLVLRQLQAQDPTMFAEGKERRRRCGVLLRCAIP